MTGPSDTTISALIASTTQVGRVSGREPWREFLLRLTGGRWPRRRGWPVVPRLATPWQDTVSPERTGWRMRAANLPSTTPGDTDRDEFAFAVDYQRCTRCRIGWVEQPCTLLLRSSRLNAVRLARSSDSAARNPSM